MTMELERPLPIPTPTTEPFWSGITDQKVMLQHCRACSAWVFYPRSHCSNCLSPDLEWREVSGTGKIYSYTITRQPTAPHFADEVPQLLAVVELNEGVRLNTVIVNSPEDELKVGMKVKPVFRRVFLKHDTAGDKPAGRKAATLLYFEPC